jgi:anti-sigma regulatory factor (Ser/Thr protein kinase)
MNTLAVCVETKAMSSQWVTLHVPCTIDCGEEAMRRIAASELVAALTIEPVDRDNFLSAVREVLWNAIEHGGKLDGAKIIRVDYLRTRRTLSCFIKDPGPGFRLNAVQHAAINNPPEDSVHHAVIRENQGMRPGGFGILMARSFADEMIYNESGNEVVLIRYLDQPRPGA